jgi:hypothetical protein
MRSEIGLAFPAMAPMLYATERRQQSPRTLREPKLFNNHLKEIPNV